MILSREYCKELNERFPTDVELCYGKHLSRKVPADLYQVMPAGKRCFVWFTYDKFNGGNTCYIVYNYKGEQTFEQVLASFDDELAFGTVFSGILISPRNNSEQRIFCVDFVSYYKGVYVCNHNFQKKLFTLSKVFDKPELSNVTCDKVLKFAMPILCKTYHEAQAYMGKLPYKTQGVRLINYKDRQPLGDVTLMASEIEEQTFVFSVRPNQEPDSYSLFGTDKETGHRKYAGKAIVCSYEQSKKLNSLFRIIRENADIDLIEESEDEDTFEDISEHKFIKRNNNIKMYCKSNPKFRKWELLSVAPLNVPCSDVTSQTPMMRRVQENKVFNKNPSKPFRSQHAQGQKYHKKTHRK